jgi:hypothetical protein
VRPGHPLLALALFVSACSESSSEARQIRSLAGETELVRQLVAEGHLTRRFARAHARYLQEAADEQARKTASPELARVRAQLDSLIAQLQ